MAIELPHPRFMRQDREREIMLSGERVRGVCGEVCVMRG